MEDEAEEEEEVVVEVERWGERDGWSGRGFLGSVKTQVEGKQVCSSADAKMLVEVCVCECVEGAGGCWRRGTPVRVRHAHAGWWSGASSHRHLVLNQQQETSSPRKSQKKTKTTQLRRDHTGPGSRAKFQRVLIIFLQVLNAPFTS